MTAAFSRNIMIEYTLNICMDPWTRFMKNLALHHFSVAVQYCPLESRNAVILHHSGQVFFSMIVSSSNPYDITMERRPLRWNLCCFEWQVSQLIIRVTEWLTQWMFEFWFCIMSYLSPETKKKMKKKGGIFSAYCSITNLWKLKLFQNLCFRIALFAFCFSSIIVSESRLASTPLIPHTKTVCAIPF